MQALELILVLLAATAALHLLAVRLVVPTPVLLVLGGAILAAIPELPRPNLSPEVIFLVFVPPLLYWTAVNTSWRDFRTNLRSISLLAVGLVLVTMTVVAVVAHALAPEIGWGAAFVLGAIVSPPDPVAVTAVTRRLGVARDIVTILEGEGLVNDATALVAYRMAVAAVVAGGFSLGEAAVGFAWSAAGGLGVGLAVGCGHRLDPHAHRQGARRREHDLGPDAVCRVHPGRASGRLGSAGGRGRRPVPRSPRAARHLARDAHAGRPPCGRCSRSSSRA